MVVESLDIAGGAPTKAVSPLRMRGASPSGGTIGANSYFLEKDGAPWFAVSGELHYSRLDPRDWRDALAKMRMCGVEIVSTYVFWNHHEAARGDFDWSGRRDLRAFLRACSEEGLCAIARIGPWCHGEARNGGFPDWLYGSGLRLRSNDSKYLELVAGLYREIGAQLRGLLYKDGGPVIGCQLENEHMHAGAPWEATLGAGDEWVDSGGDGEAHILELKRLALEAGIDVPLYTCTAWGGASAPFPEVLPLWGGYSFQPWLFYGDAKEHPATPEYIFRDKHGGFAPYACCEMGGGMACFYGYRFRLPPAAVEAMAVVKAASGCNLLGYYMFHGGTNPRGRAGAFLNEHAVPRLSYDYQAAIGEFGQVREHAKALSLLHRLFRDFEDRFCPTTTFLPAGAEALDPRDSRPTRFAARASGRSGFLFLCNYQDHAATEGHEGLAFEIRLPGETLRVPRLGGIRLARDVACVLPFHFDLGGVDLAYATAQPITSIDAGGERVFFFYAPEGMGAEYRFEDPRVDRVEALEGVLLADEDPRGGFARTASAIGAAPSWFRVLGADGSSRSICTLSRADALRFWKVELRGREHILLSDQPVLADPPGHTPADGRALSFRLECSGPGPFELLAFPALPACAAIEPAKLASAGEIRLFSRYAIELPPCELAFDLERRGELGAFLRFPSAVAPECKRAILRVEYEGDVGGAYVGDELVADNFCNGEGWDIDLLRLAGDPFAGGLRLDIRPLRVGARVLSDASMAGRSAMAEGESGAIRGARVTIVRDATLRCGALGADPLAAFPRLG